MGKQRRKPHQSHKPGAAWNLQAPPKQRVQSQGPSQKGLPVSEPLPKTKEEALRRASYILLGIALRGQPDTYDAMIIAMMTAPFEK